MFDWLLQLLNTIEQSATGIWKSISSLVAGLLFIALLPFILLYGEISGRVERAQMRAEVFSYVQENKDALPHERTVYKEEGIIDNVSAYGFYYDARDLDVAQGDDNSSFGVLIGANGRRTETGSGWYYDEQICPNWYYYEYHGES